MTIEYIRYALKAHSPDDFLAGYRTAVESLKIAPECLSYELSRCEEEANVFILRIHWASTTAHLEGFRKGANFPPFLAAIKPFIPEIVEMRHYAETPLAWTRPG